MKELEIKPLSSPEALELLKASTQRGELLARLALRSDEALERLRAEKRVYLSYLGQFSRAVLERRVF